jgi:hypothetical protein
MVGDAVRRSGPAAERGQREVDRPTRRDHHDVRGHDRAVVAVGHLHIRIGVAEPPPPLVALDRDLHRVGGLACQLPDRRDGRHHDHRQHDRRRDRPADLQPRVPVQLRRHPVASLAVPVLDRDQQDPALDDQEDEGGRPQDEDEEVLLGLCRRTRGVHRVLRQILGARDQQQRHGE